MKRTRILKRHKLAVKDALDSLAQYEGDSDAICHHIAEAVLTAYDDTLKYVVVNDDHLVFGPYASRASAYKAIERGYCADRHGQRAMVLPMKAAPTKATAGGIIVPPPTTQLPLWDVLADDDARSTANDDSD